MDSYQSPIILNHECSIDIQQHIHIKGTNYGAKYNDKKHIYEVSNKIILRLNSKEYRLIEYHFHIPSEHNINDRFYKAEIHYVFQEINEKNHERHLRENYDNDICMDICGCGRREEDDDGHILVIGRVISSVKNVGDSVDLTKLQVNAPSFYYEYDGTLTTGNFAPVRWLVGDNPLRFNIEQLLDIAKPARSIQTSDGRIILYAKNC